MAFSYLIGHNKGFSNLLEHFVVFLGTFSFFFFKSIGFCVVQKHDLMGTYTYGHAKVYKKQQSNISILCHCMMQ